jgi:hypothetical protein
VYERWIKPWSGFMSCEQTVCCRCWNTLPDRKKNYVFSHFTSISRLQARQVLKWCLAAQPVRASQLKFLKPVVHPHKNMRRCNCSGPLGYTHAVGAKTGQMGNEEWLLRERVRSAGPQAGKKTYISFLFYFLWIYRI